jgi:hypothetical protein
MPFVKLGLQIYQRRKGGLFHLLEDTCEAPPDSFEDYALIGNAALQRRIGFFKDTLQSLEASKNNSGCLTEVRQ